MTSWIEQPGYPVLSVSVENDELVLRQQQFFTGEGVDQGRLWQIPLNTNWTGLPDVLSEAEVRIQILRLYQLKTVTNHSSLMRMPRTIWLNTMQH
jgi:aminopeptidase N